MPLPCNQEVGLPKEFSDRICDLPPNNFPYLTEVKHRPYTPLFYSGHEVDLDFPNEFRRYRMLSLLRFSNAKLEPKNITDIVGFECLDEQAGGQIVRIELNSVLAVHGDWAVRFLNTSILHFAEFLCLIKKHKDWEKARVRSDFIDPEEQYTVHGKEIGPLFHVSDPPACEEGTGWWEGVYFIENGIP